MNYKTTHPFTVIEFLSKFLFLLIIPIVQKIVIKPQNAIETINTFAFNILIVFILIIITIKRYKSIKYKCYDSYMIVRKGIIIKNCTLIPFSNVSSVNILKSVFTSIFRAVKLNISACGKKCRKGGINLNLTSTDTTKIVSCVYNDKFCKPTYISSLFRTILVSAFWSNSATGLLILSLFVNKLGNIVGEQAKEKLYSTVSISLQLVAFGVPPVMATLAYILFAGWAISFLSQIFRYANLKVFKCKDKILIRRGLISINEKITSLHNVNAIITKQTSIMKLFRIKSIYMNVMETKKEKRDKNLFMDCGYENDVLKILKNIFSLNLNSQSKNNTDCIYPSKFTRTIFILKPFLVLTLLSLAFIFLKNFYNEQITLLLFLFSLSVTLWWLIFSVLYHKHSGLFLLSDILNIKCFNKMKSVYAYIKLSDIESIKVKQNMIDKLFKKATFQVSILSNKREIFSVKSLNLNDVENFVEKVNNYCNIK